MNDSQPPANDDLPTFAAPTFHDLAADPEIAPLLDFEPVPRQLIKANGWSPAMQRMFIAWLAHYGSAGKAADELGKARSGIDRVYKAADAGSFRDAWDGAIALAERRLTQRIAARHTGAGALQAPFAKVRRKTPSPLAGEGWGEGAPGQILNEHGDYEDEDSYHRRGEEARDSISIKLQRARRLFLHDISDCPAKRAAFEILTELPVDWEVAAQCRPQADEPWRKPTARDPDLLLTAENGWLGEFAHGPDKKAELLAEINEWRAGRGKALVSWKDEGGGEEEDEEDGD